MGEVQGAGGWETGGGRSAGTGGGVRESGRGGGGRRGGPGRRRLGLGETSQSHINFIYEMISGVGYQAHAPARSGSIEAIALLLPLLSGCPSRSTRPFGPGSDAIFLAPGGLVERPGLVQHRGCYV